MHLERGWDGMGRGRGRGRGGGEGEGGGRVLLDRNVASDLAFGYLLYLAEAAVLAFL